MVARGRERRRRRTLIIRLVYYSEYKFNVDLISLIFNVISSFFEGDRTTRGILVIDHKFVTVKGGARKKS